MRPRRAELDTLFVGTILVPTPRERRRRRLLRHTTNAHRYVRERAAGGVADARSTTFVGEDLGFGHIATALKGHPSINRLDVALDRRDVDAVEALADLVLFRASPDYDFPPLKCGLPLAMPPPTPAQRRDAEHVASNGLFAVEWAEAGNAVNGYAFHKSPLYETARAKACEPFIKLVEVAALVKVGCYGGPAVGRAAAAGLSKNPGRLRILSLCCGLGPKGARALGEALETAPATIEKATLHSNELKNKGAISLARGLARQPLRSLDLGDNKLGSNGVVATSDALSVFPANRRLRKLKLRDNPRIGAAGFRALGTLALSDRCSDALTLLLDGCRGLSKGTSLKALLSDAPVFHRLGLTYCRLGPRHARTLAAALSGGLEVYALDASWNRLGGPGLEAIADALSEATGLTRLFVKDTRASPATARDVKNRGGSVLRHRGRRPLMAP